MNVYSSNSSNTADAVENNFIAFREVPLTALSERSMRKLSRLLNAKENSLTKDGYQRDWRGLAILSKQKCFLEEDALNEDNPTEKVIQLWCTNNPTTATFDYLEHFLCIMERWDVADHMCKYLVQDSKAYQKRLQLGVHLNSDEFNAPHPTNPRKDFGRGYNKQILTISDKLRAQEGLSHQMYDAFVLYADTDVNYAFEILTKLEDNPKYNFKLCVKYRDLLSGVRYDDALYELIEERSKNLIVILTDDFLKSPENRFLTNYTKVLKLMRKKRKIISLIYGASVVIPKNLQIYEHLYYNSHLWSKLANSMQNVNDTGGIATLTTSLNYDDSNSSETSHEQPSTSSKSQINVFPNSPSDISRACTIHPDDCKKTTKKKGFKLKSLAIRSHKKKATPNDNVVSRSAHPTGHLNTKRKCKWLRKILRCKI